MIRKIKAILIFIYNLLILKFKVLFKREEFVFKKSLHNKDLFCNKYDYKIFGESVSSWGNLNYFNFKLDPRSNVEIKNTLSCLIRPYSYRNFDIKYIWEASRFQFIPYTANSTQLKEVNELIKSFITSNPVGFGPNWMCAMEVSIRAINICEYVDLFNEEDIITDKDRTLYSKFIYEHFLFIYYNLEKNVQGYSGNHYLSNLIGLIIISNRFIPSSFDKKIIKYAISELDKELNIQFNNDGSYFENSTMYHRLATEMIFFMLEILSNFEDSLTNDYIKRFYSLTRDVELFNTSIYKEILIKSAKFMSDVSSPNGRLVIIGDNDSGRFIDLDYSGNYDDMSASYLLQNIYQKNIMVNNDNDIVVSTTNIFNTDCDPNNINKVFYEFDLEKYSIIEYSDFGVYIFKSKNLFLTIRSNYSTRKMVHAHEDLLSINLVINGKKLLWDPGMPTYTRDRKLRDEYRFSDIHNSPLVSDLKGLNLKTFEFKLVKRPLFSKNDITNNRYQFGLEKDGVLVIRTIEFYKNGLLIEDNFSEKSYPYLILNKSISPKYGVVLK